MNIIYMHTHDSGRYLQPYGYSVPTPNLMKFAQDATVFRHCHTPGPTCSPSRAALLTGSYPHSNGMLGLANRGFELYDMNQHLVSFLNKNGYETVLSGIQHEAVAGNKIGYRKILNECAEDLNMYLPDPEAFDLESAHLAADYIKSRSNQDGHFFLSFGMINTHRDYPSNRDKLNPDYIMPPAVVYDNKENREDMSDYHYSVEVADRCAGIVIDAVRDSGLDDDTVIFFTTDHGLPFPRMKCNLYDTGTGVAFILKYPQNPTAGKALDSLVSNIDIFPTLCDLCHLPKPNWLQGVSLEPLLTGEKTEVREELFGEITYHASYEPMRSIRTSRYKLIRRYDYHNRIVPSNIDNSNPKQFLMKSGWLDQVNDRELLLDLYLDPLERINVVNDPRYREVYCDLSKKLADWMQETNDPLINIDHRLPKPEKARVNKLTCLHAEYPDYE